jgi:type I restriction enzyme S subunit
MSLQKSKLGELCSIEKGTTGIQKAIEGEYPLVVTSEERKTHNEYQFDDEAVIIPLVSGTGHGHASIKRIHYQTGKFALGSILCAVIPKDKTKLNSEFLFRFLNLNKDKELVSRMKGMANVSLPIKEIAQIEIPLPSINEQIEFTKFYKLLENHCNSISGEFSNQHNYIKQIRQAFLREAMQGKLVGQDENDEPASELLKRIKTEKQKLIAEGKLKKEKPLPPIKPDEIPFEIPENWVWCRLGEVCLKITDGTHHSPINLNSGDYKYVTAKNIKDEGIELSNITYVSKDVHKEIYSRCNPEFGDILYIKDGATTGIVTLNNLDEQFSMLSSVALLKIPKLITNKFLVFLMRSPYYYQTTRNDMYGVAITRVTLEKIHKSIIPVPPLSEQERIVKRIEQLMKICDELEQSVTQSKEQTEMLLRVALKEALQPI